MPPGRIRLDTPPAYNGKLRSVDHNRRVPDLHPSLHHNRCLFRHSALGKFVGMIHPMWDCLYTHLDLRPRLSNLHLR